MRWRYPVKVAVEGAGEGALIGEAETLGEAVALARRQGFSVREAADGGNSRWEPGGDGGPPGFVVSVEAD
jgi:hypothetical protein